MNLTQEEIWRYARQLPVIGVTGQCRLKQSHVLCIGAGGLGCPVLQYLVAAGVGDITLFDGDDIELSNLQRQILFTEADVGANKAHVAAKRLSSMNHDVTVHAIPEHLTADNAATVIAGVDVVVDATDNFSARYLMNRHTRWHGIPLVSASVFQTQAQLSVFNYQQGPCYECLYPEAPPASMTPNCAAGGVMGLVPGVVGLLQANEVIKILVGEGDVLSGTLLTMDLHAVTFQSYALEKKSTCHREACYLSGDPSTERLAQDEPNKTIKTITCVDLQQHIASPNPPVVLDVREGYERDICCITSDHIPLREIRLECITWPLDQEIIVFCKAGARSAQAAQLLQSWGFTNISSLEGGILQWIADIDGQLMRY